jgi:hypothetical protein
MGVMKAPDKFPPDAKFFVGVDKEELVETPVVSFVRDGGVVFFDASGNRLPAARVFAWDWSSEMSRADWEKRVESLAQAVSQTQRP